MKMLLNYRMECFVTGYDLLMSYEKSIADDDKSIAKICEKAKKYKIGVVLTAFTKGNKQPQNSAFVINKSGNILMKYSKVHTCDFADERNVESGKEFKVCDFEGIQLGVMICYDREYPESARILMLKGAEMVLCQDLVQVKMSFSHSNLPAIPKLPVDTILQNHRVTYNRNDYEFVWYYKTFPSIQIPGGMHVCNC